MFQKDLVSGEHGKVSVSEEAGKVTLSVSVDAKLGGGEAAGVAGVGGSLQATLEGQQLVDLGLEYIAHKFPAAAGLVEGLKKFVDAEIAKA